MRSIGGRKNQRTTKRISKQTLSSCAALFIVLYIFESSTSVAQSKTNASELNAKQFDASFTAPINKVTEVSNLSLVGRPSKASYPWHIDPRRPIWQAVPTFAPHPLMFALGLILFSIWIYFWEGIKEERVKEKE